MARYVIRIGYKCHIDVPVEGEFRDEGEALEAARKVAEDADKNDFTWDEEIESKILTA